MKNQERSRPKLSSKTFSKCLFRHSTSPLIIGQKTKKLNFQLQQIRTAPEYILVGSYLTNKGKTLLSNTELSIADTEVIMKKYSKNRYTLNPESVLTGKAVFH